MAIAVKFDKSRAVYYLDCLANGRPVEPTAGGWTGNEMLALAGACFFGAMSQGPQSFWLKEIPETLHPEHRELVEQTFDNDLHAAIEFYSHLTTQVADDQYDSAYAPQVVALVSQEGDLKKNLVPIKGIKGHPDRI